MASAQPFAVILRQHRLAAGHSQESLAELAGLSRRGISDLERALKQTPHRDTVERLADALALEAPQRAAFLAAARGQRAEPAARPTRPSPRSLLPLVGRLQELALVDACLTGAAPPALFLAGEPGIGKSRLLAEAARVARERGWEVLAGGCVRQQGQEPFEPLVSALARHISQTPPARQRVLLQGCAWLVRLLPELAEQHVVPAPSWALPPPQERRLMFQAVARYLANAAGPEGTLLLLDDLQWAGSDAIALLASLVALDRDADAPPLRLIAAHRSTEMPPEHPLSQLLADLDKEMLITQRTLPLFTLDESIELFGRVWHERSPEEGLSATALAAMCDEVVRRADGLPFFVVSSVRALQSGAYPGGLENTPDPVAQSVRTRVAMLPAAARDLLGLAAIVGRRSAGSLLLAVSDTGERVTLDMLDAVCQAGLLVDEGDGSYRFAHDLIREVVEGDLTAARRTALHREVATALERLPGEPPVEQLAFHYARAGNLEQAAVYLEQAGDRARARYAHTEALAHFQELVRCLDELGRAVDAARAREKLGDVLTVLGRYDDALRALELAADAYRAADDVEGAASTLGRIAHAHARAGTAVHWLEQADPLRQAERLASAGCTNRGMARLYANLATALDDAGQYAEQLDISLRAIELARALGDETTLCFAMMTRGIALQGLGRWNDAVVVDEETAVLSERIGELPALSRALMHLGDMCRCRGDFVRAHSWYERAVATATRFGDAPMLSMMLSGWSCTAFWSGDWALARSLAQRAAHAVRNMDRSTFRPDALREQGRLDLAMGEGEMAASVLDEVIRLGTLNGEVTNLVHCQALLAERDVLAGHPEAARQRLAPLHKPAGAYVTVALPLAAWAYGELGELVRAEDLARQAIAHATRREHRLALADALRVSALVALRRGRNTEAAAALDEALAHAAPFPYAEAKALYVSGQLHASHGEPERAREAYEQALAICARLGERLYAEHIERALAGV